MEKRPIILAYDGFPDKLGILKAVGRDLDNPKIVELLSYVKFSDAFFVPYGGTFLIEDVWKMICKRKLQKRVGIFLDLNFRFDHDTLVNIAKHLPSLKRGIMTVASRFSKDGYLGVRGCLPGVKIALSSSFVDCSEQEFFDICSPEGKLLRDMRFAQGGYERYRESGKPIYAFDLIACSPWELKNLWEGERASFGRRFKKIVKGVRDEWMSNDQKETTYGVAEAMINGADYVVMSTQIQKGNPERGITAEESLRLTKVEIEKAFKKGRQRRKI